MSSPMRHANGLDPALRYAPPWVRQQGLTMRDGSSSAPADWSWESDLGDGPDFEDDRKVGESELSPELESETDPIALSSVDGRGFWKVTFRLGAVLLFAALVALVVVSIPDARQLGKQLAQGNFPLTLIAANQAAPLPKSVATKTTREHSNLEVDVALRAMNEPRQAREPASWLNPIELASTTPAAAAITQPPPAQPPAPAPAVTKREPAPNATLPGFVTRHLGADELASMLERADDFIKSGDLSSSRLLLQRAAEAGNARAALTLGGTFDPNVLKTLGSREGATDMAMARLWYERAEQLGSAEASDRLRQLATAMNSAQ
jgi:hypothetical protein